MGGRAWRVQRGGAEGFPPPSSYYEPASTPDRSALVNILRFSAPSVLFETFKIVLTAGLTLVGGALLLLVTKLFAEPLNEQKRVIGEIARALLFWARVYTVPREAPAQKSADYDQAENELHGLAAKLIATTIAIPWYRNAQRWFGAPPRKSVDEAARCLRAIANTIYYTSGNAIPNIVAENTTRAGG